MGAFDEAKYRGIIGIGYENFNYQELSLTTTEASVILTDLSGNPIKARAVTLYCPDDCNFMFNSALPATPPILEADLYFGFQMQVTSVSGKVTSGTSTLYIYYAW